MGFIIMKELDISYKKLKRKEKGENWEKESGK
jgi:hypothetical protein